MPEIRTVTALKRKRAEIAASITLHEKQLAQARSDLTHVEATMRIFAASGRPSDIARYVDTFRQLTDAAPNSQPRARMSELRFKTESQQRQ